MNKNVCVFCSASDVSENYLKAAREFASLLPKNGYDLVWGGTNHGVMKVVASAVQEAGGRIYGVTMKLLEKHRRMDADEMVIAEDLGARKALMIEKSDALAVLIGGIGTLDELMGVLELKKHNIHDKPVVVLDTDNFYDGLKVQLEKMSSEGFISHKLDELVHFADSPKDAIDFINGALRAKG